MDKTTRAAEAPNKGRSNGMVTADTTSTKLAGNAGKTKKGTSSLRAGTTEGATNR